MTVATGARRGESPPPPPKAGMEKQHGGASVVFSFGALVAAYLFLNSSLNLLNKYALGHFGFRFPFLLTSLTLNQIIKSAIPVVTCALAIVVENRWPCRNEAMSLVTLTLGVMLAVWQGTVSGKPYAIAFCIAATVSNAAMMTFSGKLLSEKLDVVHLTFYTAPVSLACLAPFCYAYERHTFALYYLTHQHQAMLMIGITSVNALAYNLVHSLMIKRTSAVTTTVLGEAKIIGLLVLSALLLGEARELTATMTAGVLIATTGFVWYSQTQIVKARGAAQPLAPVPSSASMRSSSSVRMLKILEEGRDPRTDKAAEAD
eukprot:scaffold13.g376.t1